MLPHAHASASLFICKFYKLNVEQFVVSKLGDNFSTILVWSLVFGAIIRAMTLCGKCEREHPQK